MAEEPGRRLRKRGSKVSLDNNDEQSALLESSRSEKDSLNEDSQLQEYVNTIGDAADHGVTGNIYRCRAVGFHFTVKDGLLSIFCFLVQVVGPCLVFEYSRRRADGYKFATLDEHINKICIECPTNVTTLDEHLNYVLHIFIHDNTRSIVVQKVLGTLLLCMIFLTVELNLVRAGTESEYLRRFFHIYNFTELKWLLMDTIANSLCRLCVCLTVGTLLAFEDNIVHIILDCTGLLFLSNIDNLSTDIGYHISEDQFQKVVKRAHAVWLKSQEKRPDEKQDPPGHGAQLMTFLLRFIDMASRFLAQIIIATQIPIFAIMSPYEEKEPPPPVSTGTDASFNYNKRQIQLGESLYIWVVRSPLWECWYEWAPLALVLYVGMLLNNARVFVRISRENKKDRNYSPSEYGIVCDFIFSVFFRLKSGRKLYTNAIDADITEIDENMEEHYKMQFEELQRRLDKLEKNSSAGNAGSGFNMGFHNAGSESLYFGSGAFVSGFSTGQTARKNRNGDSNRSFFDDFGR